MSGRLTDAQRRDRALSETEFRQQVDELATMLGYGYMHVDPLRTKFGWATPTHGSLGKGWPDSVFVRPRDRRIIFIEFKRELGKVDPDQERVLAFLRSAGIEAHVVRPSDFEQLAGILR